MSNASGNDLYCVLLHVVEGIGLSLKGELIVLHGTLNGVKFEVEGLSSDATTVFNSNFIWESTLNEIKKMKTDNRPVKLEVFTKDVKSKEIKRPIGFVLLPIRSLQIATSVRMAQIKLHWHKLGGISGDWKIKKPELYLFIMIVKKTLIESGQLDSILGTKSTESAESIFIRPSETSTMLTSQHGIFIKVLEDERLIQVGNTEEDCDVFIVILTFKNARNLEQLIDPSNKQSSSFYFHYDLLGTPSTLVLTPKGNGVYSIQEKISISFKTSLKTLREYLGRIFYIPIDLYYNDSIIGNYRFDVSPLINVKVMEKFLLECTDNEYESKGSFLIETVFDVLASSAKPFVEYVFTLKYLSSSRARNCVIVQDNSQLAHAEYIGYVDSKGGGDPGASSAVVELPPTIAVETPCLDLDVRQVQSSSAIETARNVEIQVEMKDLIPKFSRSEQQFGFLYNMDLESDDTEQHVKSEFDEKLAYNVINELEDWKHHQMENFLIELKRKEINHLAHLSSEWEKRKTNLQMQIEEKLQQSTILAESLEKAQKLVKEKGYIQLNEERLLERAKHELEKSYAVKFIEINERARRISDDMDHQIKLQEIKYRELEMTNTILQNENARLKADMCEIETELKEMRKTFLPRDQLTRLFQDLKLQSERLVEIEKSKKFYKEQWAKIVREVHQMKLEGLHLQERHLKKCRSTGLTEYLRKEQTELLSDRCELDSIKLALNSDSDGSLTNCNDSGW